MAGYLIADFLTETNESIADLDVALVKLERTPGDQATLQLIFRLVHTIKGTCGFLGLPRLERVAHAAENVLGKVRDGVLAATPLAASQPLPQPAPASPPGEPVATNQTIRVTVDVLEDLMTLVSELVLTRNQLLQLARTQDNAGFSVPLQRLSHITSDLQEGVMKTRMQPIGNAWNKLPRLVRDLSREMDKKIELTMLGADTELDRQVLELIKDPLTHMVRNSGDHGLESPADRRAAGKSETGNITLNAFHEGGHIIIEISDDGRGLPLDRIRAKVLKNGLATEAELATMTEAQLQRFIFRPGFSTATVVTAVSGRGVGMDVVKTNIEKIGGTIDLKSVPAAGTTFTIKIPLTLAIVSALIVEAAGERFAIPQISVVELVRAQKEAGRGHNEAGSEPVIERINDTPVLRLRDRLLPLVNLNDLLALGDSHNDDSGAYIVVTQVGANSLSIIVDRVFDTEEIVVKPVAPILRHVTMFSGNTILGDGSVIMILDPNGIARRTSIGAGADVKAMSSGAADALRSTDRTAMLLFHAGSEQKLAVPLGLVARLEDIPRDKIEISCGSPVTQYRGKLMPLVALSSELNTEKPRQSVLVFNDGDRSMGLMVDEIVDVVEDRLHIELSGGRAGMLGTAVIAGLATDVIDTGYWLTQAWQDWFHGPARSGDEKPSRRVLVVEDSDFFRQLVTPILGAAGYHVTAAPSAAEALRLREAGAMFEAIVSDIAMPDMNGLDFARAVRAGGSWATLPMIALSGHSDPADIEAGRDAGFTDYVTKFQRDALIASLRQCMAEPTAA
jgi:two-component system, chemotaxis family, sensor kinase CheA